MKFGKQIKGECQEGASCSWLLFGVPWNEGTWLPAVGGAPAMHKLIHRASSVLQGSRGIGAEKTDLPCFLSSHWTCHVSIHSSESCGVLVSTETQEGTHFTNFSSNESFPLQMGAHTHTLSIAFTFSNLVYCKEMPLHKKSLRGIWNMFIPPHKSDIHFTWQRAREFCVCFQRKPL